MKIFIKLLGWFFYIGEIFKGRKVVSIVIDPPELNGPLTVRFGESKLTIYCSKRQYRRKYDKWFVPTDRHSVYTLYSEVSDDAPDSLKIACDYKVDLPALLPECVIVDFQKVAVIHAYLDILMGRLLRINVGLPP